MGSIGNVYSAWYREVIAIIAQKPKHPMWYYSTIRKLARYKHDTDRIDYLIMDISISGTKITPAYSDQPHGSSTSDSTGDLAERVGDKRTELKALQRDIALLDYAVSKLSEIKQLIIDLKYKQDNKELYVQSVLRKRHGIKSRDSYYRFRDEAVEEIAMIMGEKKGE